MYALASRMLYLKVICLTAKWFAPLKLTASRKVVGFSKVEPCAQVVVCVFLEPSVE